MSEGEEASKLDRDIQQAIRASIGVAVKEKLGGYNSPLDPIVKRAIDRISGNLESMIVGCITSLTDTAEFKEQVREALHEKLARTLVSRFGGELEKQVNDLKANPSTRAQITLAIARIASGSDKT